MFWINIQADLHAHFKKKKNKKTKIYCYINTWDSKLQLSNLKSTFNKRKGSFSFPILKKQASQTKPPQRPEWWNEKLTTIYT